mmetsp:Transcript_40421/g.120558  ORF Transcript_40421/g.120558 Transcript_40421/m.120558 type:complete len:89 (+) Transcript_40421:643-909(+)|eukprot:365377-Chlamydomonas_euryale.AAC.48
MLSCFRVREHCKLSKLGQEHAAGNCRAPALVAEPPGFAEENFAKGSLYLPQTEQMVSNAVAAAERLVSAGGRPVRLPHTQKVAASTGL